MYRLALYAQIQLLFLTRDFLDAEKEAMDASGTGRYPVAAPPPRKLADT